MAVIYTRPVQIPRRRRRFLVPSKTAVAGTIAISTPAQYKVFQRSGGGTASIAITGTYTGSPTAIEASFNGGAYATIDNAPAGGTFSGSLTGQSAGRGTLTVRFTNDTSVSANKTNIGIGDVIVVAGDSIADGRGTNAQSYAASGSNTASAFNESDAWIDGNDPIDIHTTNGSHWPLLASLIMADQSVPVAFITIGTGSTDVYGTGVNSWAFGNSDYNALKQQVTDAAVGSNGVKAILWHLGPNAMVNASTPALADYNSALDGMANGLASEVTGAPPSFVVLCGEVNTGSPPDRRLAEDNVRMAIKQAWGDNANVKPGPVLIDQDYTDDVHPKSDAELQLVARRWWTCLKESLYGGAAGYGRGPRVTGNITKDSTNKILTITFDRDLASGTTYGGFRVENDGSSVTITSVTRATSRRVVIELQSAANGTVTVSFGSNDDAKGQTVPTSTAITLPDSNTVTLPAEPFVDTAVTAEGGAGGGGGGVFGGAVIR